MLEKRFWVSQNQLIQRYLEKCNTSAWVLPDYLGHTLSRKLIRLGRHSNVGANEILQSYLTFSFEGYVPSAILKRVSAIQSSGPSTWWPKCINRTDTMVSDEVEPPNKPNMKGNTQMIFILLFCGFSLGSNFMTIEIRKTVWSYLKIVVFFCYYRATTVLSYFLYKCKLFPKRFKIQFKVRLYNGVPRF